MVVPNGTYVHVYVPKWYVRTRVLEYHGTYTCTLLVVLVHVYHGTYTYTGE